MSESQPAAEETEKLADDVSSSDAEAAAQVQPENAVAPSKKFRWHRGVRIVLIGSAIMLLFWFGIPLVMDGDQTFQVFATLITSYVIAFLLAVWWTFLSGLTWRTKLIGLAIAGGFLVGVKTLVRVEQLDGAMVITDWSWRWEQSAEEKAVEYFNKEAAPVSHTTKAELTLRSGDWPQFRGTRRDGVVDGVELVADWDSCPPKELWRHPIGLGWSSFSLVDGHLFTQEQRADEELVVCYDAETGKQLWAHAHEERFEESVGGDGPRATPTFHEGKLYSLGATGWLSCLQPLTGEVVWERNILQDASDDGERVKNIEWAMCYSPLIVDDMVIVNPGGGAGRGVIAYDRNTGDIIWANGDDLASYAGLSLQMIDGQEQLLLFDAVGLKGLDLNGGEELWRYPFTNMAKVNAMQPIVRGNQIFISTGYGIGSVLLNVSQNNEDWSVEEVWRATNRFRMKFNDPVFKDGFVYGLDDGILACHEFKTGERTWKKGRYGFGQLLLVGDHILVFAEDGSVDLVAADPGGFQELGSFQAIEGKTWNHPVLAHGRLYLRNAQEVACFEVPVKSAVSETVADAGTE
ncbi:PQQ-binding-like beta-propeller repeat protein [Calycomorphotria hydatis]|uniref:Outer membrane biogenesis protein BamB n=1 Tax=Calycomorphotria hydatis TaxID=2528027 RepID=A0A517TAR4_9PLAN|nr:PQQ-binding-like beta-propeller repeat protein [Calycomorphotria hydatis]QDT65463.1 outer membrane biogenesis protein BamB [Calycomorphotria hydatis]